MTTFDIIMCMKRWILYIVPSLFIVSSCDKNDISNTFKFNITNNEGGEVFGTKSGEYSKGSTIILEASPFDGYEFLGFYEENNLVCAEVNYVFDLNRDISLNCKFKEIEKIDITGYKIINYTHYFTYEELNASKTETEYLDKVKFNYNGLTKSSSNTNKGVNLVFDNQLNIDVKLDENLFVYNYQIKAFKGNTNLDLKINSDKYKKTFKVIEDDLITYYDSSLNSLSNEFKMSFISNSSESNINLKSISLDLLIKEEMNYEFYSSDRKSIKENNIPNGLSVPYSPLSDVSTYYKDIDFSSTKLKENLHDLIANMTFQNYGNARYYLQFIDENPAKVGYLFGIYNGMNIVNTWDSGTSWNREHVWPQSKMQITTSKVNNSTKNHLSDLHNLRAINSSLNSSRGNGIFGEGDKYFYPNIDKANQIGDFRGDIARILFYMDVRYNELSLDEVSSNLSMGALSYLKKWNELDPVDHFEKIRNDKIYLCQGNRNPFIDYPGIVRSIY